MYNKKTYLTALIISFFSFITISYAENMPLYAGLGYNSAKSDPLSLLGTNSNTTEDLATSGVKVFVGAEVSDHFNIELGYSDLGTVKKTTPVIPNSKYVQNREETMTYLSAIGILPIRGSLSLLGEAGIFRSIEKVNSNGSTAVPLFAQNYQTTTIGSTLGLGLKYDIQKTLAVKLT